MSLPKTIAVASGKGGTGKTTVAVGLACAFSTRMSVSLADCDVEEPNAHLLLGAHFSRQEEARVPSVVFDGAACTACGQCVEACRFNAIAVLNTGPLFFPELCHACMGCVLACPAGACTETTRRTGSLRYAERNGLNFIGGVLDVGRVMATGLIRHVRQAAPPAAITLLDCPPGTSCDMIAAVRGADEAILVTEPTPFGLNDLQLAMRSLRELSVPFSVVVNRAEEGQDNIRDFCRSQNVALLAEIPDSRPTAECYSRGENPYGKVAEFTAAIDRLAARWIPREAKP